MVGHEAVDENLALGLRCGAQQLLEKGTNDTVREERRSPLCNTGGDRDSYKASIGFSGQSVFLLTDVAHGGLSPAAAVGPRVWRRLKPAPTGRQDRCPCTLVGAGFSLRLPLPTPRTAVSAIRRPHRAAAPGRRTAT